MRFLTTIVSYLAIAGAFLSSIFSFGIRVSKGNRDSSLLFYVMPYLENHPLWGVLLGSVISVTK